MGIFMEPKNIVKKIGSLALIIIIAVMVLAVIFRPSYGEAGSYISIDNCSRIEYVGLAKFNNTYTDYKVLDYMRTYNGETRTASIDPGHYAVSVYNPTTHSIIDYVEFKIEAGDKVKITNGCIGEKLLVEGPKIEKTMEDVIDELR